MTRSANSLRPRRTAKFGDKLSAETARRGSKRKVIADLLWDKRWHSNAELLAVGGSGFNARIDELRRAGWEIEAQPVRAGEWRYRAVAIGGYQPPTYVLGKQSHRLLVKVLSAVSDHVTEEVFAEVYAELPESWLDELESPEAWARAGFDVL